MTDATQPPPTDSDDQVVARFRNWFWQAPRRHGEVLEGRTVTFLELFYDLVYVVVIAQAAHHLAAHVSLEATLQFAVIFGLIWVAWLNGSLYHDIHGRQDGRTRSFVFLQMALLALLAVFTADAASGTGAEFALVYTAFMVVMAWLWYTVRRVDDARYDRITGVYLAGMAVTIAAMFVSVFVGDDLRLIIWAGVVILWVASYLLLSVVPGLRSGWTTGLTVTESMVERFGLFTIIVLGEVVVGVVDGMAEARHELGDDVLTYVTGLLALIIGFGLWWLFFDFVGRRLPRNEPSSFARWIVMHGFIGLGIAAAGASMVDLILHAQDESTSAAVAWLLTGSVALVLVALAFTVQTLQGWNRWRSVYGQVVVALFVGAGVVLAIGWLRPAPWLLALLVVVVLNAVWLVAINRWLAAGGGREGQLPT